MGFKTEWRQLNNFYKERDENKTRNKSTQNRPKNVNMITNKKKKTSKENAANKNQF